MVAWTGPEHQKKHIKAPDAAVLKASPEDPMFFERVPTCFVLRNFRSHSLKRPQVSEDPGFKSRIVHNSQCWCGGKWPVRLTNGTPDPARSFDRSEIKRTDGFADRSFFVRWWILVQHELPRGDPFTQLGSQQIFTSGQPFPVQIDAIAVGCALQYFTALGIE